jgi:hypothetical protein
MQIFPNCIDEDEWFFEHDSSNKTLDQNRSEKSRYCPQGGKCENQSCEYTETNHVDVKNVMCRFQARCHRSEFRHVIERGLERGLYSKFHEKIAHKQSLRKKMNKPSKKRAMKRNKKIINHILKLYGVIAAGIRCKTESFSEVLFVLKPNIWMVEETPSFLFIRTKITRRWTCAWCE